MIGRTLVLTGIVGAGIWWSALPVSPSTTYPVPPEKAQRLVEHAGLPEVFGERQPTARVQSRQGHVEWIVEDDGAEVMRYVIELVPVDAGHTRIDIALKGVTQGKFGNVDERLRNDRAVRNLYVAAMSEQLDSVLAHHPFRYSAIKRPIVGAAKAHMFEISQWMDHAADAQHQRERENLDKAYRDAGLD
jgi:hypothetical protein